MVNDKYLKSLKEKLIKNPEKKHSFMMLGFKYFLHKWVNNEIIVKGIIPWKEFRKNSINALNQIKSETKIIFNSSSKEPEITKSSFSLLFNTSRNLIIPFTKSALRSLSKII